MRRTALTTALLAAVTISTGTIAAATAASAAPAPAATPNVSTTPVAEREKVPKGWNMPTRLVLRNNTPITLWIYAPLNGNAHGTTEYKVAEMKTGDEYSVGGSNSGTHHYDVYLRLHVVDKDPNSGEPIKGRMVAGVFANNPGIGAPYVGACAGHYLDQSSRETAYTDRWPLDEHATRDRVDVPETLFSAWIHRDHDHDGHKVMKMTINRLDLRRTLDVR